MKKILLASIGIGLSIATFAQEKGDNTPSRKERKAQKHQMSNVLKSDEDEELIFNKHSIFGIKLNTDGYGISYEKGRFKTPRRTILYQFELNEKKHPKEYKMTSGNAFLAQNEMIYGKTNNFYQFKVGYGQQYLIGGKANKNGVNVTALAVGGLSAGLQKPYMVDFFDTNTETIYRSQFNDTVPPFFKPPFPGAWVWDGASGFTYGWNKVKVVPGVHAKIAMRFDYARFNESVTALETGINFEYYTSGIEQVLLNDPKKFFFNAYLTILFGKRK